MDRLFGILLWSILFVSMYGHVLFDNGDDTQTSALNFIKVGLQQYRQGIERMMLNKLKQNEDTMVKMLNSLIGTTTNSIVGEEMVSTSATVEDLKSIKTKVRTIDGQENTLNLTTTEYRSNGNLNRKEFTYLLRFINESMYAIQNDQRLFRQEMLSLTTSLYRKVDGKIGDLISATQAEQRLLRKEMKFSGSNVSENVDEKTSQTEQELLSKTIESLSTNLSGKIDESLSNIKTEQQLFRHEILSVTANLTKKVDTLLSNRDKGTLRKEFDVLSDQFQKDLAAKHSEFDSVLSTANQTVSVCTKEIGDKFDNLQTNLEKLLIEETVKTENFTLVLSELELRYLEMHSDCDDILKKYSRKREINGVYNIMGFFKEKKAVYCDMTTDNGGWTIIQRRVNGLVDFYRNWAEYKDGFGYADHEYWIGNDMLHRLTSLKPQELRVDMERFNGEKGYAVYSRFSVGDEASKYKLEVQWGYSGNAGNSLDYHNNMTFSTPDQDNDGYSGNCANYYRSGWWFDSCYYANPNGQYTDSEKNGTKYIVWHHWENSYMSLKAIQLMIRPRA